MFILDCHLRIAGLTALLSLLLSVLVRLALLAFLAHLVLVLVVWVLPCLGLVLYLLETGWEGWIEPVEYNVPVVQSELDDVILNVVSVPCL